MSAFDPPHGRYVSQFDPPQIARGKSAARKRALLKELAAEQADLCPLCGKGLPDPDQFHKFSCDPMRPTIDHIKPLSKGGSDERENKQAAHMICNQRKGNGGPSSRGPFPADWYKRMGIIECRSNDR